MPQSRLSSDSSDFVFASVAGVATLLPPPSSASIVERSASPRPAPALSVSRRTSTSATLARLPRTSSLLPPPRVVAAAAASTSYPPPSDASIYNPALTRAARPLTPSEQSDSSVSAKISLLTLPPILPLPPLDEGAEGRPSSLEALLGDDASDRDTSGPSPGPLRPATAGSQPRMPYEQGRDAYPPRGHARGRNGKGSADLTKARGTKPPSQKAMLSRALQKANTAVQLDNAQNFEGARLAYGEACDLLQQVLGRTSGNDDQRKLEAIRRTYSSRIDELDQMGPWQGDSNKALPARPESLEYRQSVDEEDQVAGEQVPIGTANMTAYVRDDSRSPLSNQLDASLQQRRGDHPSSRSASQESLRPASSSQHPPLHSAFSRSPARARPGDDAPRRPSESTQMPPPLSTLRSLSPPKAQLDGAEDAERPFTSSSRGELREATGHLREGSQNSWLDPIDESAGSSASSVHSRTSSLGYRRKHIRGASGNTENEFDTALDAAIEAAYDEGYEPMGSDPLGLEDPGNGIVDKVLLQVEMAREQVRPTEREAYNGDMQRRQYEGQGTSEGFYDDNSSDEEERMLEEMTRGYGIEDFTMTEERKLSVTRPESRGRTTGAWQTPIEPSHATETKPPAVANDKAVPRSNVSKTLQPSAPPPTQSLPELPAQRSSSPQSVRNRRLSGQNPKQLKIETTQLRPPPPMPFEEVLEPRSRSTSAVSREMEVPAGDAARSTAIKRRESPPPAQIAPNEPMAIGSPPSSRGQPDGTESSMRGSGSPSANNLRKNFSSSSLRSMKSRNMSLSNIDDGSDMSPGTPSSNSNHHFGSARTPAMPALPTTLAAALRENVDGSATAGLHLFEDSFHVPNTPGSPNPMSLDAPVSLEPCPNDFMLRPFWLMRCLYQTLVHPRGGYLSTKLFVPREVWKVKGVKLKNVEDKMANCDYLTAALLKLAKVDTCDADAVLEEMQSLEGVLEQVQATLARKLGSEVGVQSSGVLFKEASNTMDADGASIPRTSSVSGKSSSFSWRRLRSKNSAMGLGGVYSSKLGSTEGVKEIATLSTLPMTPHPTSRPAKRDVAQAQFMGPNAQYMGSLARLFDAAQAIDQIARQVDDPGLRHADKTQVGLELCTRHAAEFFGFYICRFVLADLSMLLDKFIKRGSEWVLA
ncbi:hypothetical protein TOPH_06364 [Tolypocladium ophioglossoides CBS 100239]|uniref:MIT domain-containing protein n=1 Tax=Tolypocladium ophioglossoides (strain CBS 100239) TaxID=1163406 RepID=A0A0L0N465_TOLOC|nr:hypothetical protein TOPH_06364 [Tolypocladium ophioglossoides CBS 100239]